MPSRRRLPTLRAATVALGTVFLLALAGPAAAHVTVSTDNPEPGGFAVYTVRVPNERDDAGTTRVEVQLPDGLEASRYEPIEGWDIALEDGVLTAAGGLIGPGQFLDFRFQARNPEQASDLVFPAIQTYEGGEEVAWTGPEDADTPAPIVVLGEAAAGSAGAEGGRDHGEATAAAGEGSVEEESSAAEPVAAITANPVGVVALIVAVLAVLLGGLALVRRGRPA